MDVKDISTEESRPRWFIDLEWYQQSNRSFLVMAQRLLCPECRGRLKARQGEVAVAELLSAISDCCSKKPGFITGELPILESIFRLFLANGNEPLDLEELGKQLSEWRGGDTYSTSLEILSRLLSSDDYYGLRPAQG